MAIKFEATGDFSDLIAENQKYQRQVASLTEELHGVTGQAGPMGNAGVKAFRDLQRAAEQARKSIETPADAFGRQVAQLDAALGKNMLSPKEHAAAIDQLAARYAAAAGPIDQFRIAQDQLGAKLASNQITQDQYAAGMDRAKAATLASADSAGRYQVELLDLDRQLAAGDISQEKYAATLAETRNRLIAAADPVDKLKIQLAALNGQADSGAIAASTYDQAISKLQTDVDALPPGVAKIQQQQSLLDAQYQRGLVDAESYRQATNKLQTEYLQSTTAGQRYREAVDQVNRQLTAGVLSSDEHAKAVNRLEAEFAGAATPTEKYEKAVADLTQQVNEGKLTAEQYSAAVDKQKQVFDQATGAVDASTNAGEKHGGMVEQLGTKMLALGAGYMSFQAILGKVQAALAYVNQETEKAIGSADRMTDSERQLIQVVKDGEDLDQVIDQADQLAAAYGEDRDVVRRVIFSARSEGFEEAVPDIIKYSDVVSAESAATVAGQVPGLFGEGSIDPMTAVNATLAAAKQSRLDFERIAVALPKVAEGGALQGSDPAEAMGVLSVMASHFGSGDTAADRFKGLGTKMALKEETKGKGFVGGVEALQAMDEESRKEFLGESMELNVAYELMTRRMDDVKERIALVNAEIEVSKTGGKTALQTQYEAAYDTDTRQGRLRQAMEERRKAKITEEIANERQFAEEGAKREAAIATEKARQKDDGYVGVAQYGGDWAGWAASNLGLDARTSAAFARAGTEAIGGQSFGGFLASQAANAAPALGGPASTIMSAVKETGAASGIRGLMSGMFDGEEQPAAREQSTAREGNLVLDGAFRQTKTGPDTAESTRAVSQQLNDAYKSRGATELIQRGETDSKTRIEQVRSAGAPDKAAQVKDPDSLAELQKVTALLARSAMAIEDLRDVSKTIPRPGSSAVAAVPSSQRLSR